jgi:hypothetical protein
MRASHVRFIALTGLLGCLYIGSAVALGLADLTNRDAAQGIKGALEKGAASAVDKLPLGIQLVALDLEARRLLLQQALLRVELIEFFCRSERHTTWARLAFPLSETLYSGSGRLATRRDTDEAIGRPNEWREGRYEQPGKPVDPTVNDPSQRTGKAPDTVSTPATRKDYESLQPPPAECNRDR